MILTPHHLGLSAALYLVPVVALCLHLLDDAFEDMSVVVPFQELALDFFLYQMALKSLFSLYLLLCAQVWLV